MKNTIIRHTYFLLFFTAIISGCRPKFYEEAKPAPSAGGIDFTRYVAIGSSITAGFMDGALYTEGQNNAYPNLIAKSISAVKPGFTFYQPDINSENGFANANGGKTNGKFIFTLPASCNSQNFARTATPGAAIQDYAGNKADLDNLGVPYISTDSLFTPLYSAANDGTNPALYLKRIVSTPGNALVTEAAGKKASFFTVWIGYNELRAWASSGGTLPLPSADDFQSKLQSLVDNMLADGQAKGVIANIPDISLWPVITNNNRRINNTSDPIGIPLKTSAGTKVSTLNFSTSDTALYNGQNGIPYGLFKTGSKNNYAITTGKLSAGGSKVRQLVKDQDFIILSRSNLDSLGSGDINYECATGQRALLGIKKPIQDKDVLDSSEVILLRKTIADFNARIQAIVAAKNSGSIRLALVDMFSLYDKLAGVTRTGFSVTLNANKGVTYGTAIVIRASHPSLGPDFGGFYSLDRIHPNPKGQSVIANEFIKVINASFNAALPLLNPDDYRGNPQP